MYLLRDGKLENIDISEDKDIVTVVTTVEELKAKSTFDGFVKDEIYTLKSENEGYIFRRTQSPYKDDSGLGNGISGHHSSKGSAINKAIEYKFRVYQNDKEITK